MQMVASANDTALTVRFPKSVLKSLDKAAKKNGRSRNTEIIVRLVQSLEAEEGEQTEGRKTF